MFGSFGWMELLLILIIVLIIAANDLTGDRIVGSRSGCH